MPNIVDFHWKDFLFQSSGWGFAWMKGVRGQLEKGRDGEQLLLCKMKKVLLNYRK